MLQRLLISAVFLLCTAPAAHAAGGVNWGLTPDGNPLLAPATSGRAVMTWWVCPPSEQCREAPAPKTHDGGLWWVSPYAPGEVARGTIFEGDGFIVEGAVNARVEQRSPMWMGRLTARSRPRVAGVLRVGQHVRPVGAIWAGGWADDTSTLALVACRTACEYLVKPDGTVSGPGPRALKRKHRGWSVYAVDHRAPADGPAPALNAGPVPRPVASALLAVSKRFGVVRSAA